MPNRLDIYEIQKQMENLPQWELSPETITKIYTFKDFKQSFEFVKQVAEVAEEMDHHPDILIFGWNKVRITLSTHSAKGLTHLDFELSNKIESIYNNLKFEG